MCFTVALLVLGINTTYAQTCTTGPDGFIELTSQQEVIDFQATIGPCTIVDGNLTIAGEGITDLTPLSDLVEVQGDLSIRDNPQLSSLGGLSNLESVDNLSISRNHKLSNLSGLTKLTTVRRGMLIYWNNSLKTLDGIPSLVTIYSELSITNNPVLENIHALATATMPGSVVLIIRGNGELRSLIGLPAVEQFARLEISANEKLQSLEGIKVSNGVLNGAFSVQNNPLLNNFEGMEWLQSVAWMIVYRNHALLNFRGLSGLKSAGQVNVVENNSLQDFIGLEQLEYIGNSPFSLDPPSFQGDFWVRHNPALTSFRGLLSLQSIEGSLWVNYLLSLSTFQGLNSVKHIGSLSVSTNPEISRIDGFTALRSVINISIFDNKILKSCSVLEPLLDVIDHDKPGPGPSEYNAPDISGDVYIERNAAGCNSKEQIVPKPDITKVMTGSWYSPASAGEGFMIHVVREHIPDPINGYAGISVGYFYGYDEQGQRFWLTGTHRGDMQWDVPIKFKAILATGGVFEGFDTTAIEEIEWGSFSFTPGSCTAGTISMTGEWTNQPGIYEKTLEVVRLGDVAGDYCAQQTPSVMSDSITGSWYDPATSGQGFSIHKITEQTGAVYFYGFDNAGAPLWLLGTWSSPLLAGETVEFEMHRFTGGTFTEVNPGEIVEEPWGTMSLRMDDCGVAYAEMDGLDGKQIFFMQQLAGSLGLECME